jgi:hypothetical protein
VLRSAFQSRRGGRCEGSRWWTTRWRMPGVKGWLSRPDVAPEMKLQVIGAYGALVGGVRSIGRARRERPHLSTAKGCPVWRVRLGAVVPGVPRRRLVPASGVSRKRFAQLRGTSPRERAVCMSAMRAHLAVSASQSRTFCARRVGRRHRCWPETASALGSLTLWNTNREA